MPMLLLLVMAVARISQDQTSAPPLIYDPIAAVERPAGAHPRAASRYVRWRATITPDGHVIRCEIIPSSSASVPKLDQATCALIRAKAIYGQAIDDQGKYAFGIAYGWQGVRDRPEKWIDDKKPVPRPADLVLSVNRLQEGLPSLVTNGKMSSLDIPFNVVVNAHGAIEHCRSEIDYMGTSFEDLGCQKLGTRKFKPAIDERAKPVRSVQPALVRFSALAVTAVAPSPAN